MQKIYQAGTISECLARNAATVARKGVERRAAPREPAFLLACYVWSRDASMRRAATVRDLSLTGARLELDYPGLRPSRMNTTIPKKLTLFLCSQRLEIDCNVIWQDGRHFGVKFTSPSRSSQHRFR